MKNLGKYIKPYIAESILAPLFKMLEAAFELLVPVVMAKLIDYGINENDPKIIAKQGIMLVVLAIVGFIASVTAQYFAAKAAMGVGSGIRKSAFAVINELSYSELDKIGSATLITRMTGDINQVQTGVNMTLRLLLRSPCIVFGALIMAFLVNGRMALIFVVVLPVLFVVVFSIIFSTIPLYRGIQEKLDGITLHTRENLKGVRVIRAFGREKSEMDEFENASSMLRKKQLFAGRISMFLNPLTYMIISAGLVAIVYKGAGLTDEGFLTQGELTALVNYMNQILIELVKLANLIITISRAVASANRVSELLSMKPSVKFPDHSEVADNRRKNEAKELSVIFENVTFSYESSGENVLSDISFSAKEGDIIGIIGGTGSGKSTLVNLIPRFYDADSGKIYINGRDIKTYEKNELRSFMGIVPQKAVLFRGTIEENMKIGKPDASASEIDAALETAQAKDFVYDRDEGLGYEINLGAKNLSGGQKQRLAIARALIKSPKILILDDSASALDFATEAALRKRLIEGQAGRISFIVSQRASSIIHADKIIVLENGHAAGIGDHEGLMESCEVYKEICYSQGIERNEEIS